MRDAIRWFKCKLKPPKNLVSIAECAPPTTYTGIKSFVVLVCHYRRFIKGFTKTAAPLYNLICGDNSGKKKESVQLTEAEDTFQVLKEACLQAPILSFPDFDKPFLLETDASGKGLGAVLSQKQEDGHSPPNHTPTLVG